MKHPFGKPLARAKRSQRIRPPVMPRLVRTRLVLKRYPIVCDATEPKEQLQKEEEPSPKHGYYLRSCINSQQPQPSQSSSIDRSKIVPKSPSKMTLKGRYMQVTIKPQNNKPTVDLLSQLWTTVVKEEGYPNKLKMAALQNSGKTSERVGKRARESLSERESRDGTHKRRSLMKRNRELDAESRLLFDQLIGIKKRIEVEEVEKNVN